MRERGVRHLPVLDGGALVGVVSQRDLLLAESLGAALGDRVDEGAMEEACEAAPGEALAHVAGRMLARRLGCAVALDGGRVVGVFTAIDALRLLADGRADVAGPGDVAPGPAAPTAS
jgi:CBS domain-containing protein